MRSDARSPTLATRRVNVQPLLALFFRILLLSLSCAVIPKRSEESAFRGVASPPESAACCRNGIKELRMSLRLDTEVRMIKGVGPQRAELLAKRGIHTLEDLLSYLPFRYEDRTRFSTVREVKPGGTFTLRVRVMSGQAVRGLRGGDAIFHLLW